MQKFYENCQIFTPEIYVEFMLDNINYKRNLYGKKILENSCGDGNFLKIIVKRYILDCLKNSISNDKIAEGLGNDIYGYEVDDIHYWECIKNLNDVTKEYGILNVKWNIYNEDFLKKDFNFVFDYIVGNPPYITYSDLDVPTRRFIKEKFISCAKGKPDYYYAFIEYSLKYLSSDGIFCYLIPNNIFKNKFGETIREILLPLLYEINDFDGEKIFKNRLTTSSIIFCSCKKAQDFVKYRNFSNNESFNIPKRNLNEKWIFKENDEETINTCRFGDYFRVSVSVATLLNEAFVIKKFMKNGNDIVLENGLVLENSIVRKAASPKSLSSKRNEYIIFPYLYNNSGELIRIKKDFEIKYPNVTRYLNDYNDKLNKRKSDRGAKWYEYGRSQALHHLNQEKILLSTLITDNVKVYLLDKETIPYSGIIITQNSNLTLSNAKRILESNDFFEYVNNIGIKSNGTSIRVSPTDIKNFKFDISILK